MEKRSRPTSVRISGVFHSFTEGKEGQQNHQQDSPESKREKDMSKGKVNLFSFKRRTKRENEFSGGSQRTSTLKQRSVNELTQSVQLQNSGEEDNVYSRYRSQKSLSQDTNKDLEHRNEQLRQSAHLQVKLDSKDGSAWKGSVLLKETANVELDFEEVQEMKVVWYSQIQIARKLITFVEDFFIYLFFLSLLLPLGTIAFLKPAICFIAYICKLIVPCRRNSEKNHIFTEDNAVIDSIHSNELGVLERSSNLRSEFQHTNISDGKTCRNYGLVNLTRKLKKTLSKKNLEPELSGNENLETENPVIVESIIRRTRSFTDIMKPGIKLQEKDAKACICDPRPYIRRFITFLRISFNLLSIFTVNLSHRVNVVLQTSVYHFARACKFIISCLIQLTPRKWLKRLLIEACHYLPDLKHRSLQLQILRVTPSRVSKKLVELYMRKVPLSVMYLHTQASLRDSSPSKKIIQNLGKIWTSVKLLLETAFLAVSTAFKLASHSLKIKRKANVVKTKRSSLLRLISKDASDKDISK